LAGRSKFLVRTIFLHLWPKPLKEGSGMPKHLAIEDTLDAVRVYCYHSIQKDIGDDFDVDDLFFGLNERVSRAMLRIALRELRGRSYFLASPQPKGEVLWRASIDLMKYVEGFLAKNEMSPEEWLQQNVGYIAASTDNVNSDTWEPLKNESNVPQREAAISAVEDVVRHVEADNGFAASQPEARNTILYSLKMGVMLLKEHAPSREQVTANILKPLKYIGDLFAKHTIGELAKKATEKLMLWLSGS
jgi:hypothetical protein